MPEVFYPKMLPLCIPEGCCCPQNMELLDGAPPAPPKEPNIPEAGAVPNVEGGFYATPNPPPPKP